MKEKKYKYDVGDKLFVKVKENIGWANKKCRFKPVEIERRTPKFIWVNGQKYKVIEHSDGTTEFQGTYYPGIGRSYLYEPTEEIYQLISLHEKIDNYFSLRKKIFEILSGELFSKYNIGNKQILDRINEIIFVEKE